MIPIIFLFDFSPVRAIRIQQMNNDIPSLFFGKVVMSRESVVEELPQV